MAEGRTHTTRPTLADVRALVDEQAEDEALWALNLDGTLPISEAYLQQELRRLHALIEEATAPARVDFTLGEAEAAIRAKAGTTTTSPVYGRRLHKFLRLLDWARSDA